MDAVGSHEVLLRVGEMSWRCVGRECQDFCFVRFEKPSRQSNGNVK